MCFFLSAGSDYEFVAILLHKYSVHLKMVPYFNPEYYLIESMQIVFRVQ